MFTPAGWNVRLIALFALGCLLIALGRTPAAAQPGRESDTLFTDHYAILKIAHLNFDCLRDINDVVIDQRANSGCSPAGLLTQSPRSSAQRSPSVGSQSPLDSFARFA